MSILKRRDGLLGRASAYERTNHGENEEDPDGTALDRDRLKNIEGACKAKSRRGKNIKVAEEDGWRGDYDGIKEGHLAEYA
jgi:hypothetical protein